MKKEKRKMRFWFALNRPNMRFREQKNNRSCLDFVFPRQSRPIFFIVYRLDRLL